MSETPTFSINLDKLCAECGKAGALKNGLCISCTTKALNPDWEPNSKVAKNLHTYAGLCLIEAEYKQRLEELDERQLKNILARKRERDMARGKKGHNVNAVADPSGLKDIVARIENVEDRQAQMSEDKKLIYQEAKARGFDTKVLRALISRRKKDEQKLREFEELLDIYRSAVGDLSDTPLGKASEPKLQ